MWFIVWDKIFSCFKYLKGLAMDDENLEEAVPSTSTQESEVEKKLGGSESEADREPEVEGVGSCIESDYSATVLELGVLASWVY